MLPRKTRKQKTPEQEIDERIQEDLNRIAPLLKRMTECLWCGTQLKPPYTPCPPPCKNCGGINE